MSEIPLYLYKHAHSQASPLPPRLPPHPTGGNTFQRRSDPYLASAEPSLAAPKWTSPAPTTADGTAISPPPFLPRPKNRRSIILKFSLLVQGRRGRATAAAADYPVAGRARRQGRRQVRAPPRLPQGTPNASWSSISPKLFVPMQLVLECFRIAKLTVRPVLGLAENCVVCDSHSFTQGGYFCSRFCVSSSRFSCSNSACDTYMKFTGKLFPTCECVSISCPCT